jgi:hypothetical protein
MIISAAQLTKKITFANLILYRMLSSLNVTYYFYDTLDAPWLHFLLMENILELNN